MTISLPLQGHYRAGRYMPVRIAAHANGAMDVLTLSANGALATEIPAANARIDAVIPWLAIREISEVRWAMAAGGHAIDLPLHPLEAGERLIGYAGGDPDALKPLFPENKLVGVSLDVTAPLPGPIEAWGALDGLVLDASAAARVNESQLRGLLSMGTVVAVISDRKPGGGWPWRRRGGYWYVQPDIAGPTSAYMPTAYAPTQLWLRGWPAGLRRRVVLYAIALAILIAAATLLRPRWRIVAVLLLCAIGTGVALPWRARQSVNIESRGSVIVLSRSTTQGDTWTYRAVLRPSEGEFNDLPMAWPVFGYRRQADDLNVRLRCGAEGRPRSIVYRMKPRQALAFQTREFAPFHENIAATSPITSPLRAMADDLYMGPNDRMDGQVLGRDESQWPTVVIQRDTGVPPVPIAEK
ncbi:MAG TPA: hypothetical protein VFC78_22380 [Tepidisphaeraceae bacterium]|nr:hypothetical protein [Tepidisphaeraceae bacterium]